jgi:serine/threonine-protein kinase
LLALALRPGEHFGPYEVVGPLGKGGMASVYKVYQADLDRHVALKVLPAEFLHDETFGERFRREAKVIARLEHPHIVPIYAFGIDEGLPWMTMRLITGGTVAALLKTGPVDPPRTLRILRDVAEALDYAHEKGIVHRDVKPPNMLLDERDRAYLADFGVARMREGSPYLTQTGMVPGTPQYMAPEQGRAGVVDHRCDVYALGVVAYEMLSGRVPFTADTPVAVVLRHLEDPVPRPEGLPEPLTDVLIRCLAKRPEDRWATAGDFVEALRGAQPPTPAASQQAEPSPRTAVRELIGPQPGGWRPRRSMVLGGIAALVALVGLIAVRGRTVAPMPSPSAVSSPSPSSLAGVVRRSVAPTPGSAPSAAPVASPPPRPGEGRDGLEYVFIPPQSGVVMGCVAGDKDCFADEKPVHKVTLPRGYWLGKTEVTVGAYKRFSAATGRAMPTAPPSNPGWSNDEFPIVYLAWGDAAAFCEWTGGRLPTEAEWECAARGGAAGGKFPWGNGSPVCRPGAPNGARFEDGLACKPTGPERVASFEPNAFGLYDMSGNVWEWCADWYGARSSADPATDPKGPPSGAERVLRGGAFNSNVKGIRVSLRNHLVPVSRSVFVGLRCARDTPP